MLGGARQDFLQHLAFRHILPGEAAGGALWREIYWLHTLDTIEKNAIPVEVDRLNYTGVDERLGQAMDGMGTSWETIFTLGGSLPQMNSGIVDGYMMQRHCLLNNPRRA